MTNVAVHTNAALHEEQSLTDYYRVRNLYLAQTVLNLEADVTRLTAEISALRPETDEPKESEE